jgi:hypothetical protein
MQAGLVVAEEYIGGAGKEDRWSSGEGSKNVSFSGRAECSVRGTRGAGQGEVDKWRRK